MVAALPFDASRYLTKVNGSDYLEVKWRLVWLRETHPDAIISTELFSHDGNFAVFKAQVEIPAGGSSTGWGSEGLDDFRDYIEKAETKALGRALAALGFGTQFCPDFDFGAAAGRVVDAPIDFASTRGRRLAAVANEETDRQSAQTAQRATDRQLNFIRAIANESGMTDDDVDTEASRLFGARVSDLGRKDASALIERLQARRSTEELAS